VTATLSSGGSRLEIAAASPDEGEALQHIQWVHHSAFASPVNYARAVKAGAGTPPSIDPSPPAPAGLGLPSAAAAPFKEEAVAPAKGGAAVLIVACAWQASPASGNTSSSP